MLASLTLLDVSNPKRWQTEEYMNKHTQFWMGGGQTFYVEDVGGDDDVDGEEEDVSEANILVSEASKPSAGARIFRGP